MLFNTRKSSRIEILTALHRAGLLTGLRTHLRNLTSNTAFQVTEEAARPFMVLADLAMMHQTGKRTVTGINPAAVSRAIFGREGVTTIGVKDAFNVLRHGTVQPSKQQTNEISSGFVPVDIYVNAIFRMMEAGDRLFKVYALRRSLEDQARALALTERATNSTINVGARTRQILADPQGQLSFDAAQQMAYTSIAYADFATYQNDGAAVTAIKDAKNYLKTEFGSAGMGIVALYELFVPFDRTPTNILARVVEFSPVGLGQAAYKYTQMGKSRARLKDADQRDVMYRNSSPQARAAAAAIADDIFTRREQREFAQTFGRASLGTSLLALGIMMALKGWLDISGLTDYDEEKDKYFAKRSAAIRDGSLRVPLTNQRIVITDNPAGKILALGATMAEQYNRPLTEKQTANGIEVESRAGRALAPAFDVVLSQPLLDSLKEYLGKNGKTLTERGGEYVGSYVPTILNDAGEVMDERARKTFNEGFSAQIRKRIPQGLPFNRTALKEQPSPPGGYVERGNIQRRLLRAVDPMLTTTNRGIESSSPRIKLETLAPVERTRRKRPFLSP